MRYFNANGTHHFWILKNQCAAFAEIYRKLWNQKQLFFLNCVLTEKIGAFNCDDIFFHVCIIFTELNIHAKTKILFLEEKCQTSIHYNNSYHLIFICKHNEPSAAWILRGELERNTLIYLGVFLFIWTTE